MTTCLFFLRMRSMKRFFLLCLLPSAAFSLPQGEIIQHGEAHLSRDSSNLQVTVSERAIIDWSSFSIASQEGVRFAQPSSSSVILNRVTGYERSEIAGKLLANGSVYLINPQGIIIGKDAVINTASFLASTLSLDLDDFIQGGDLLFQGDSKQEIINLGTIETSGGSISLFAHRIENRGMLQGGDVSLAAGHKVLLKANGETVLSVSLDGGRIDQGGFIQVIETSGVNSLAVHQDGEPTLIQEGGRILLVAEEDILNFGTLEGKKISIDAQGSYIETSSGKLKADSIDIQARRNLFTSGTQQGNIDLFGDRVTLAAATLEGKDSGSIFINSSTSTFINGSSRITVEGSGGFIEVSGKELSVSGAVRAETVLLDPMNIVIDAVLGVYPQYQFIDPNAGMGFGFGYPTLPLPSGNVVVAKFGDGTSQQGAVYLYNGFTAALVSVITGSQPNDRVGSGGVTLLTNGNYVISSTNWRNGGNANAGAVTWANGISGISGVVSTANSIVGSQTGDFVGTAILTLTNGNFVTSSFNWANGGNVNAGAVSWGNGTNGTNALGLFGAVSALNSIVGSQAGDQVSSRGVTKLTNDNYVVSSPSWANGGNANAGAATWGNGTNGTNALGLFGAVSALNSFVGTQANDNVSLTHYFFVNSGITALTNGNYVVSSPDWANGANVQAGAATWGNGTTGRNALGLFGAVSALNSIVGILANDHVSIGTNLFGVPLGIVALTNGNYVIASPDWANGVPNPRVGAATWGNGMTGKNALGLFGPVSALNSFVGIQADDAVSGCTAPVSAGGIIALTNGNYVVGSPSWRNSSPVSRVGAATWGNGTTGKNALGLLGAVTAANSFVGDSSIYSTDQVGEFIVALTNGNYVVQSNVLSGAGGATWGNGTTGKNGLGTFGLVSAANSIVGDQANDGVGGLVVPLTSGNYVVVSNIWQDSMGNQVGAVTWANGTNGTDALGLYGFVSTMNSIVGSQSGDQVGLNGVVELTNGNYVILSPVWSNGVNTSAGAATWANGTNGTTASGLYEAVSDTNSFVGTQALDYVGNFVTPLANGNYVVRSSNWANGGNAQAGAVTWGNGTTGQFSGGGFGAVSVGNSFVGSQASDQIGDNGILSLSSGDYLINSSFWANGVLPNAGAVTWGNGTNGTNIKGQFGALDTQNSITGLTANTNSSGAVLDVVNGTFIAKFVTDGSGAVRVGIVNPNQMTYLRAEAQTMTTFPQFLTDVLQTGSAVTLQANNDITISSPIIVPGGAGGAFTLQAGGSLFVDADIDTANGNLTLIANETLANGVVDAFRPAGNAVLSVAPNVTINMGGGDLLMDLRDGAGKTNSGSGDLTLGNNVLIQSTSGNILMKSVNNIVAAGSGAIQTGSGSLTMVVDNLFPTPPGVGSGIFSIPQVNLSTGGSLLRLYAGLYGSGTFPAFINGTLYYVGSPLEQTHIYYPGGSGGIPFEVYYKTGPGISPILRGLNEFDTSMAEAFLFWKRFRHIDPYSPTGTEKDLIMLTTPSLVE